MENRNPRIKGVTVYQKKNGEIRLCSVEGAQHTALSLLLTWLTPSESLRDRFDFVFYEKHLNSSDYADELLFALVKRNRISLEEVDSLLKELREDYGLPAPEFNAKWE